MSDCFDCFRPRTSRVFLGLPTNSVLRSSNSLLSPSLKPWLVTCDADPDDVKQAESFGLMCRRCRSTIVRICFRWHDTSVPLEKSSSFMRSYDILCTFISFIPQKMTSRFGNTATGCRCQEISLQSPGICMCVFGSVRKFWLVKQCWRLQKVHHTLHGKVI